MNNLKKLRKESGLKQQDLAEKLSISRSTVAKWETGKNQPDNETLLKLSSIFNTSIDYILNNDCFSPPTSFEKRLKELRKSQGLTMKKLGELIGVAESTVSLYENGKRHPDYYILKFLAEYFNVSTDYLLGNNIDDTNTSLGSKLKNRRKELGLTMLEVANKVGVSEATVSRWESGHISNMGRDKITLLAQALSVSPSYIMECDINEQPPAPSPILSENEQYLIDKFRNLSWKAQSHVLQTVDILSEK